MAPKRSGTTVVPRCRRGVPARRQGSDDRVCPTPSRNDTPLRPWPIEPAAKLIARSSATVALSRGAQSEVRSPRAPPPRREQQERVGVDVTRDQRRRESLSMTASTLRGDPSYRAQQVSHRRPHTPRSCPSDQVFDRRDLDHFIGSGEGTTRRHRSPS